jgi:hypothetical protein
MSDAPTVRFGFAAPAAQGRADELATLWRQAVAAADTPVVCICHGFTLGQCGPDVIERNILDTLRTRYRDGGRRDLRDIVEKRLAKSPFAGLRPTFEVWLRSLGDAAKAGGPASAQEALCADLAASLISFAEGAGEFVCE